MTCLHCGKKIGMALLRKSRGSSPFCSEEHRLLYMAEQEKIALARLIDAQLSPRPAKRSPLPLHAPAPSEPLPPPPPAASEPAAPAYAAFLWQPIDPAPGQYKPAICSVEPPAAVKPVLPAPACLTSAAALPVPGLLSIHPDTCEASCDRALPPPTPSFTPGVPVVPHHVARPHQFSLSYGEVASLSAGAAFDAPADPAALQPAFQPFTHATLTPAVGLPAPAQRLARPQPLPSPAARLTRLVPPPVPPAPIMGRLFPGFPSLRFADFDYALPLPSTVQLPVHLQPAAWNSPAAACPPNPVSRLQEPPRRPKAALRLRRLVLLDEDPPLADLIDFAQGPACCPATIHKSVPAPVAVDPCRIPRTNPSAAAVLPASLVPLPGLTQRPLCSAAALIAPASITPSQVVRKNSHTCPLPALRPPAAPMLGLDPPPTDGSPHPYRGPLVPHAAKPAARTPISVAYPIAGSPGYASLTELPATRPLALAPRFHPPPSPQAHLHPVGLSLCAAPFLGQTYTIAWAEPLPPQPPAVRAITAAPLHIGAAATIRTQALYPSLHLHAPSLPVARRATFGAHGQPTSAAGNAITHSTSPVVSVVQPRWPASEPKRIEWIPPHAGQLTMLLSLGSRNAAAHSAIPPPQPLPVAPPVCIAFHSPTPRVIFAAASQFPAGGQIPLSRFAFSPISSPATPVYASEPIPQVIQMRRQVAGPGLRLPEAEDIPALSPLLRLKEKWSAIPNVPKWSAVVVLVALSGFASLSRQPNGSNNSTSPPSDPLGLNPYLSGRAAVELRDEFRSGLAHWQGEGDWSRNWSLDHAGFLQPGSLALFKPSVRLSDYEFEFLGQIQKKSLGWVVRASNPQTYQAMKLLISTAGALPQVDLVRYPVIDGKQGAVSQRRIPLDLRMDTIYRVSTRVNGSDFTVTIQGQVADYWSEPSLANGGVGFFAAKGELARVRWLEVRNNNDILGRLCALLAPRPTEASK